MIKVTQELKVVVVIPAGRRRYMEVLWPQLMREIDFIDELRFCVNTNDQEDLQWMEEKGKEQPKITFDRRLGEIQPFNGDIAWNPLLLCHFWEDLRDPDCVYLRLDDDVIYISEGFVEKMINFRMKDNRSLFILPNVINNAICDSLQQRMGALTISDRIHYDAVDPLAILNGEVCEKKHRNFLKKLKDGTLDDYKFPQWTLIDYERISINSLCWFGKDLLPVGKVGENEEFQIGMEIPQQLGRPNKIYGEVLCSHYSFHTQREYLDQTNILEEYKKVLGMKTPTKSGASK